jgi:hypothetical protein
MNAYCDSLGIEAPRLEAFHAHREVNTYARLIVALLERGAPMTLVEVAERFEEPSPTSRPRRSRLSSAPR